MLDVKSYTTVEGVSPETMVAPSVIKLVESLGYDIELRFVPRLAERTVSKPKDFREYARYYKQYLYKLTFPNGKVYIGTAWDISKRWANNGNGYRGQKVWQHIKNCGWENIQKEIVLYIPFEEQKGFGDNRIRDRERELIREYEGKCYNEQCTDAFHKAVADKNRANLIYVPIHWWEVDGVTKPAKEWCEIYGVAYSKAKHRMDKYGLTPKQALTFPPIPSKGGYNRDPMRYWRECGCFDGEAQP